VCVCVCVCVRCKFLSQDRKETLQSTLILSCFPPLQEKSCVCEAAGWVWAGQGDRTPGVILVLDPTGVE
jgi:hypothetical protein